MPDQNPMDCDYRQHQLTLQQHSQLTRSPVWPLTAQSDDARIDPCPGPARTQVRSSAVLLDSGYARLPEPLQPEIARPPANLILPTSYSDSRPGWLESQTPPADLARSQASTTPR